MPSPEERDISDSARPLSGADEYELAALPPQQQQQQQQQHQDQDHALFPAIAYDDDLDNNLHRVSSRYHGDYWTDARSNSNQHDAAISIIDDAASSVCLDDIVVPLEDMAKTIYLSNRPNPDPATGSMSRKSSSSLAVATAGAAADLTDFDEYNRRTALQVLAEKKKERRDKRQLRRRLRQQRQELYFENYFKEPLLDSSKKDPNSTLRVSYNVDHFNGHRQNENYNHQLNLMFAKNNNLRMNANTNADGRMYRETGLTAVTTSGAASYITDNIDDMSSSDGRESDDDELFDDDLSSGYSSFEEDGDEIRHKWFPRKGLKRRLMSRHLSSTAFAGAIGVSSMLAMGQALFASGPLGSLLGFLFSGVIAYCVLMSYGEMVSFLPLHTGIPGVISRFVDPSMGTAVGFCYWFSNAIALPLELTAAAMMLTDYKELSEPGVATVWIIVILCVVLIINLCHAKVYGEFQYMVSMVRVGVILVLTILLIVINRGAVGPLYDTVGFRFWNHSKSDFASGIIYGPFRQVLPVHVLYKSNTNEINIWGIPGAVGRFLQVWQAIITGARALMGSDMVFASVGEARNPRRSLAKATRWIFWRIIFFYLLGILIFGITIYAGDSSLIILGSLQDFDQATFSAVDIGVMESSIQHQHSACDTNAETFATHIMGFNSIPWIVALQTVSMCSAAGGINAIFVIFAISTGSAQLYASSRTLYGLVRMHIDERKIKHSKNWWLMPGWCSRSGVPTCAMLISFPFAFLAFLTLHTSTFNVFNILINISSTAAIMVWAGMALAFLRFYYAVRLTQVSNEESDCGAPEMSRPSNVICRSDIGYPFKSPFQPLAAWLGLFGCTTIFITQGYLVFLRTNWSFSMFVASYISPFLFLVVYLTHKFVTRSKMPAISKIDLERDRHEIERAEWAEDRKYGFNLREVVLKNWAVITGNRYHRRRRRGGSDGVDPRSRRRNVHSETTEPVEPKNPSTSAVATGTRLT